jgi:hypothetical protein
MRRKSVAILTATTLALTAPAAAIAGQGGVPNSTKPCPGKATKAQGPKKGAPNTKGKKCGFNRTTNGTVTTAPVV